MNTKVLFILLLGLVILAIGWAWGISMVKGITDVHVAKAQSESIPTPRVTIQPSPTPTTKIDPQNQPIHTAKQEDIPTSKNTNEDIKNPSNNNNEQTAEQKTNSTVNNVSKSIQEINDKTQEKAETIVNQTTSVIPTQLPDVKIKL